MLNQMMNTTFSLKPQTTPSGSPCTVIVSENCTRPLLPVVASLRLLPNHLYSSSIRYHPTEPRAPPVYSRKTWDGFEASKHDRCR